VVKCTRKPREMLWKSRRRRRFPIVSGNELIAFDSLEDIKQYKNDAFSNENGVVYLNEAIVWPRPNTHE